MTFAGFSADFSALTCYVRFMSFTFNLETNDGRARAAVLHTDHGDVLTPVFMPVGTQAAVKAATPRDLLDIDAQIILANAYHLFLRPGLEIIAQGGGIHEFMNWRRPVLTDSGGFQVLSLSDLRKISDEGILFQSHIDGSKHMFTPRTVIEAQKAIGADIIMSFDYCASYPCTREEAEKAVSLTTKWSKEGTELYGTRFDLNGYEQVIFGIVQGSIYEDLRILSARQLMDVDFPGYALGGLSVGEDKKTMWRMTETAADLLPVEKPRYMMGVGTPLDLVEGISRGIDMFDCVMPTRNARNGTIFTSAGKLVLKNAAYAKDFTPIDPRCSCHTCAHFSRAYLRHLFNAGEILGPVLATHHSLFFYCELMRSARRAIEEKSFLSWKKQFIDCYTSGPCESADRNSNNVP